MEYDGSGIWEYWDIKRVVSGIWVMGIKSERALGHKAYSLCDMKQEGSEIWRYRDMKFVLSKI